MSRRIDIDASAALDALVVCSGFVARAARLLRVTRPTLFRFLRATGLDSRARDLRTASGWNWGRPR